jgi:polar amino acid transport system substrate-binding protein
MTSIASRVLVVLTLVLPCGHAAAQAARPPAAALPDRELVIGTKEAPPFAMKARDGTWHGISIDLWQRIAERLHLRYRWAEQPTVQALVEGTAAGSFDAAIAAITVTSARQRMLDFSQPFYTTGLGVAVPVNESAWTSVSRALLSFGFFQAVAALLGTALCVGFVIWLLERRKTEYFSGAKGLGSGVWWSAATMTQRGATEHAPATLLGRVVATGWMIASVMAIAVFTAGITSALTKRELQGAVHAVNDLRSVRVGAVVGTAAVDDLSRQRIAHRGFAGPQEGLQALQAGSIDAFVYDKPLLTWLVLQDHATTLRMLDIAFDNQNYAVALPKGSPLRDALEVPLLEETEGEWWQQTLFRYLGTGASGGR